MIALDARYPGYGLGRHKGYPTPAHLAALRALGVTPVHRRSFGLMFQEFALFPHRTVAENIALNEQLAEGRRLVNWRKVRRVAQDALAQIEVDIPLDMDRPLLLRAISGDCVIGNCNQLGGRAGVVDL